MANEPSRKSSFSVGQRWGIFFSVIVSIAAVTALLIMLNYLGARYYLRFPWSIQTRAELSTQTKNVLASVTNDINVIIYYDKKVLLYNYVKDLLNDYHSINSRISVKTVDYLKDATEARRMNEVYKDFITSANSTNLVIFSSSSGTNVISEDLLGRYVMEQSMNGNEREFRNKLTYFEGEMRFTSAIFQLVSGKPQHAYFFEGLNSTHHLDAQDLSGYQKFKAVLQADNIDVSSITSLAGTNAVPADCRLLIIAGPGILSPSEIQNVQDYLDRGGRLFVLFNYQSRKYDTGLEKLLDKWGIFVSRDHIVRDPANSSDKSGLDVVVGSFSKTHPVVKVFTGPSLQLILPRPVGMNSNNQGPDASAAVELAWTGVGAVIDDNPVATGRPVPLMIAVEKGAVKGITDRGTTRILVVGDSYFLDNQSIDSAQNHAFAHNAVNWLLGQMQLVQGVGPQAIKEYTLMMTESQSESIRWIFLAAMPGGILFLGGLVWLRRRR